MECRGARYGARHRIALERSPHPRPDGCIPASFDARALVVVNYNACSREGEYIDRRIEMAKQDFSGDLEGLMSILIAKIAYVRAQRAAGTDDACKGTFVRKNTGNGTLGQFATLDRAVRAAAPDACGVETAESAQGPATLAIDVRVTSLCLVRQINEGILAMRKTTVLGSSDLACLEDGVTKSNGEWDVVDRQLVRILYAGGPHLRDPGILAPGTIDWMYNGLLAARDRLSDDSYSVLTGCSAPAGDELGSPEETADRHAWYRELASDIGDFFQWLLKLVMLTTAHALADVALAAAPFLLLADPNDVTQAIAPHGDIRVQETENHRLQIETSRYLTNADMIAHLRAEAYDRTDEIVNDQAEVREWLLRRLQDIAVHDFREYNARPYTRYSLQSILNLYDFAAEHGDVAMAAAARDVLDLSEAKFAATANRGRRTAPFRRRSEYDGYLTDDDHKATADLYNINTGGDHEVARAMLLAGQTQLVPDYTFPVAVTQMVEAATSSYRLPAPVLATAVERRVFSQSVAHAGIERVFQSPAFTISAGGVPTGPTTTLLGHFSTNDVGVAMPTVIMPTQDGLQIWDTLRFDGVGTESARAANTCVAPGFACGVNPQIPQKYLACSHVTTTLVETHVFIDSGQCPGPGPTFYVASLQRDCNGDFCRRGLQWGFMEIVEAPSPPVAHAPPAGPVPADLAFDNFRMARERAFFTAEPDAHGNGTYVTSAGRRIDFNVAQDGPTVRAVDGVAPARVTAGDVIDADGNGRATIKGTGGPVVIDFSDWSNPKRSPP